MLYAATIVAGQPAVWIPRETRHPVKGVLVDDVTAAAATLAACGYAIVGRNEPVSIRMRCPGLDPDDCFTLRVRTAPKAS
jgi:hypothetical protein